ncbi:anti-sigma factor family protein [Paenibacillus sp. S-38]|uniref:anti-sigma factor family protein n=1 Tax=Paenibacillus sp. S-38 TaxID=3416710 RepID=UPI003CEC3887
MKCEDIHEWLGVYWDLPENDPNRESVDRHILDCPDCAEEFEIWQESTELIRSAAGREELPGPAVSVSSNVMSRIYADESWRVPVGVKLYDFSSKLRRNLTALIGLSIAAFLFTFFISLNGEPAPKPGLVEQASIFGRIGDPIAAASGQESMNVRSMPTAVASLKGFNEPFMYSVGPIHTVRDYLLFISLLGLTATLLTMNWLFRTRK